MLLQGCTPNTLEIMALFRMSPLSAQTATLKRVSAMEGHVSYS